MDVNLKPTWEKMRKERKKRANSKKKRWYFIEKLPLKKSVAKKFNLT